MVPYTRHLAPNASPALIAASMEGSYKGLRREQVLRRLEAYLKSAMSKTDALARLRDSLRSDSGPTKTTPTYRC